MRSVCQSAETGYNASHGNSFTATPVYGPTTSSPQPGGAGGTRIEIGERLAEALDDQPAFIRDLFNRFERRVPIDMPFAWGRAIVFGSVDMRHLGCTHLDGGCRGSVGMLVDQSAVHVVIV